MYIYSSHLIPVPSKAKNSGLWIFIVKTLKSSSESSQHDGIPFTVIHYRGCDSVSAHILQFQR